MRRVVRVLTVGLTVLPLAACIGATPRDDFEAEVRERGGGLTADFVTGSLDVVAVEVGAAAWSDLEILSLYARPLDRSLTVTVRRVDRVDFVDTMSLRDGTIVGIVPVQDADELPLDDLAIALRSVAVDRLEQIGAEALTAFGEEGGFVDRVAVTRAGADVRISVDVESERRTATVTFGADGSLRGIE